jgi:uncharacterized DUF497 family protein
MRPTRYEWDEAKRAANLAKHGIDFTEITTFDLLGAIVFDDERRGYGEHRLQTYMWREGVPYAHSFTWRGTTMRIISLRRARNRELRRHGL